MVREILTVQVGQCGNQVGTKFWEVIMDEHGITPDGKYNGVSEIQINGAKINFNETAGGRFVPRALLVDLKAAPLIELRAGPIGRLFNPENYICGHGGGGANNFGVGFKQEGRELWNDEIASKVDRELEHCDNAQGFIIPHSLGGGTGSGLGALVVDKLRDAYKNKVVHTFTVMPASQISDTVVEPYNALLGLSQLSSNSNGSHLTVCLDNEALYQICYKQLGIQRPKLSDLNRLVALTMSGVTTSLRFPGQLNADLRKLHHNMVPFIRLHYLTPGLSPLSSLHEALNMKKNGQQHFDGAREGCPLLDNSKANGGGLTGGASRGQAEVPVKEICNQLLRPSNSLVACDNRQGKYFCFAAIFRGRVSPKAVEEAVMRLQNKNAALFVDFIPDSAKICLCDIPFRGLPRAATSLANSTAMRVPMQRMLAQFRAMYNDGNKKAFFSWFEDKEVDKDELKEAENSLEESIQDYENKEHEMAANIYTDTGVA